MQEEALLFANEAFYVAFAGRDLPAMVEIWALDEPVTCIHPGWKPLIGRDEVLESWSNILGNPDAPRIEFRSPKAHIAGNVGWVTCYEVLKEGVLVATNLFVFEAGRWRLAHHQSSPVAQAPDFEPEIKARRLQ